MIDKVAVLSCTFYGNNAGRSGAGMYVTATSLVWNCTFSNNVSGSQGGGVYMSQNSVLSNCTIYANTASNANGSGAGAFITINSSVLQCRIVSNTALVGTGGGIFISKVGTVSNSYIQGNTALDGGGGLAIANTGTVYNCFVQNNSCGVGANIQGGGGIYVFAGSTNTINVIIRNCLISQNSSTTTRGGGGFYADAGGNYIQNCTIAGNSGGNDSGGMRNHFGRVLFENTIIYSNSAATHPNWNNESVTWFTNCCSTPTNGMSGTGNTANNPLFQDAVNGNYRVQKGSPCIDAGVNQDWMNNAVDLDGHQRLDRFLRRVDMGAYEFLPQGTMFSGR